MRIAILADIHATFSHLKQCLGQYGYVLPAKTGLASKSRRKPLIPQAHGPAARRFTTLQPCDAVRRPASSAERRRAFCW
jgi:hypothetical protein